MTNDALLDRIENWRSAFAEDASDQSQPDSVLIVARGMVPLLTEAAAAIRALSADRGEAVAFRYLRQLSSSTFAWTRWLGMDELHHYGPTGDLVDGPAPDWKVEYAYAAAPPSAAPSGVSDAMVARAAVAIANKAQGRFWDELSTSDQVEYAEYARAALEAAQPQPGRVEGWYGEVECCDAKGMWLIMANDCPLVPGQKVRITEDKA